MARRRDVRTLASPAAVTRIPDKDEHRRRWSALEVRDRRRIMKAVNRGQRLDDRAEAVIAVGVARQQQRFWSRAWIIGPAISVLFAREGWVAVAANAVVAGLILGAMSWFWYRRASRAETANLDALGIRPESSPGRSDAAASEADGPDAPEDGRAGMPPAQNPPKRSRAKRRRS